MCEMGGRGSIMGWISFAEEGTPIYSMMDGVISHINYVTSQPNRDKDGKYPSEYRGDRYDAGNRVYIESSRNGQDVMIGYWHLQAATPIAVNPRTGEIFKPGDAISEVNFWATLGGQETPIMSPISTFTSFIR